MNVKLIVDIPIRLRDKLDRTKDKLMVTKSSIVKMAIIRYCDEVLTNEKADQKGGFGIFKRSA